MFIFKLVAVLVFLSIGLSPAISQDGESYPEVNIPESETFSLVATGYSREFKISVALPPGYAESNARYGVVYVLDADLIFGMVNDVARLGAITQEMTSLIVVGIGYYSNPLTERDYDMALNAAKFLQFIEKDLIPFIDTRYRTQTDPLDRTLVGHSLGGRFALYTLFHNPGLFTGYSSTSPNISGVVQYERDYFAEHPELPVKLFMSVAQGEGASIEAVFDIIQSRNYEGLEATFMAIPDLRHALSAFPAITYGLRAIYDGV